MKEFTGKELEWAKSSEYAKVTQDDGRSASNIKCVMHDDLGRKNQTTRYILPRHWLYEWFSQFHRCGTYSVLSRSPSVAQRCGSHVVLTRVCLWCADGSRRNLSLANEAQYLLVATASITALQQYMAQTHGYHIGQLSFTLWDSCSSHHICICLSSPVWAPGL